MKILCLWYASEEEKRFIQSKLPEGTEVIAPVFYGALYCVRNVASIIKEMLGLIRSAGPIGPKERLSI